MLVKVAARLSSETFNDFMQPRDKRRYYAASFRLTENGTIH
ncbi:hypothetical protein FHU13_004935 [Methylobacterium sp. R2-1]|nr:hypothetical protein [Methylobacterium sp. R2-1]